MRKPCNNIIETIGNTPIVKLNKIVPNSKHTFWVKLEYFNPGNSVKDRIAVSIIEEAEKRGDLKPGGTIIEATSGNTGLGLAMVSAVRGYKCIFVMPDKISEEKRAVLRAYGAKVVITPTAVEPEDPRSYLSVAQTLVKITPNSFLANQYHTPDNRNRHYMTTGPEILEQIGDKLDVFVAGAGTGGTISGVGKYLKEKKPSIKIVCADPYGSILADLFYHKRVIDPPHSYKVEGVGEDMLPENVQFQYMDDFEKVDDKSAFLMTRELVLKEGICVGPSAAMALVGAIKYSEKLTKPSNILVLFPDSGRSYISKAFNDEWMRENGFLPSPLKSKTLLDVIQYGKKTTDLISADVGDKVSDVVTVMKKNGVSQLPVYSSGQIVGIIVEADILEPIVQGKIKPHEPIIHLIKGDVLYANLNDDVESAIGRLKQNSYLLVKNDKGYSIVTKIDVLNYVGHLNDLV